MAGMTQAEAQATLNQRFPSVGGTDYVAYSTDGAAETAILARTAVGATGWAAATAAQPSVKANANELLSADATGAGTITHFAIFSASVGGTQRTDWTAVAVPKAIVAGDSVRWLVGDLRITLD